MENVIVRAMALAMSGQHTTIGTIRAELRKEGFSQYEMAALSGRDLQRQLSALMAQPSRREQT